MENKLMARIIGVRYIGAAEVKEDTVTDTGAVWKKGQTHNFAEPIARELLAHTDSFVEVKPDINGGVFMSGRALGKPISETAAFINVQAMSKEELALFAHREFHRILQVDDKTDDQVRAEVQMLMSLNVLDEIAENNKPAPDGSVMVTIRVTPAERDALASGDLRAHLVPSEASMQTATLTMDDAREIIAHHSIREIMNSEEDINTLFINKPKLANAYIALLTVAEYIEEATEDQDQVSDESDEPEASPGLADTITNIDTMDKAALIKFAADNGIEVSDKAPVVSMRKRITNALQAKV
jgi:hypothetical protein